MACPRLPLGRVDRSADLEDRFSPFEVGLIGLPLFSEGVMQAVQLIFVPVPVSNGIGWQDQKLMRPPPYPAQPRNQRAPKTPPPIDRPAIRRMVNDARRMLSEDRRLRFRRELDR
jgi:hypothetical protein